MRQFASGKTTTVLHCSLSPEIIGDRSASAGCTLARHESTFAPGPQQHAGTGDLEGSLASDPPSTVGRFRPDLSRKFNKMVHKYKK